ncbi:VapC toxin protein [Citrifermentans bremense]|uniref:VapC toxin protein n=1 Tax=Citrifermentans bremense TaxID=60035 RepID=A0A6S6M873_9BACT|nr:type II toxin-antitoxin system VapC family toxin [Citrifermentans bremense]BCG47934.1 VapC toxin protein [Citrifermentans bremense]
MNVKYLLDTCLVSELVKKEPDAKVVVWLDGCDEENLFLSVLTIGEIQKGISKLPDGERKETLQRWLEDDLTERFKGRILDVDRDAAMAWGRLLGSSASRGETLPVMDSLIAATAINWGLVVVTRNVKDMGRCTESLFNPWE